MLSRTFVRACSSLAALGLAVGAVAIGSEAPASATEAIGQTGAARGAPDPRRTQELFVDPTTAAYQRGGIYRQRIGARSQAFWVVPDAYDTGSVRARVTEYTAAARAAHQTPVLTVYGIPGRDCGQYSSGNPLTTAAEYHDWITQVARGLRRQHAIVILEPDALALFSSPAQSCPTKPRGWQPMLRFASRKLSSVGAWVYLDAGNSNWTPYRGRPRHLQAAGIRFDRGFSTNVSNFRPTADERRYAAHLLRGLHRRGITGKHYVVDTSRNGVTPPRNADQDFINPTWAELGRPPRLVFRHAFDGTLWVKRPGESDGTVHGGGPAGEWCDMLADRLLGDHSADQGC